MARDTLHTLNSQLMEQMELLMVSTDDQIKIEADRAKAVALIAGKVIDNARLVFDVAQYQDEFGRYTNAMPVMLTGNEEVGVK